MPGRVIIKPNPLSNIYKGFIITMNVNSIPDQGCVIASGVDGINVDDQVIYIKHRVQPVEIADQELVIAKEYDVLAVIE